MLERRQVLLGGAQPVSEATQQGPPHFLPLRPMDAQSLQYVHTSSVWVHKSLECLGTPERCLRTSESGTQEMGASPVHNMRPEIWTRASPQALHRCKTLPDAIYSENLLL